ncbi:MAG: hypothetical protein FJ221_14040 [Lentisphaerae bacterium]|nr:hypothetical protein [Lentisphaerota bacterium]
MKPMVRAILGFVAIVAVLWGVWLWFFCRFYVGPDQVAVITAKAGDPLPPGQILAKEGQKGIREDVLGEGRYFLNPFLYEHKIVEVLSILPGKVGVVTSKIGDPLPQGEFLAGPGQKGVWRSVLGPGKYRLNPVGYDVEVVDAVSIPIGYVGVLTSLSGRQAPEGAFAGPDEKGIRKDILQPGIYYANPKQYKIDVLEIGLNQVSLLGKTGGEVLTKNFQINEGQQQGGFNALAQNMLIQQQAQREDYVEKSSIFKGLTSSARARPQVSAQQRPAGRQGRQQDAEQTVQQVMPQIQVQNTFTLNQFVTFPSRDGFEVSLDMTVEFELLPEKLSGIFRAYGDLPAVVEKALMPQILSISRLKGSAYKVTEFIVGEGREKFQIDLTETLAKVLGERGISVHNALIRHVNVPADILMPIRDASIAIEQDLTNKEKQNTARKQADLNTETSMIEQRGEQVRQETLKLAGEIRAAQDREVAQIGAEARKQVAEIESRTAALMAEKTVKLGQAKADAVRMVEGEKARGYQMKTAAFGDPEAYTMWEFASGLSPDLRIQVIYAGQGTLWTDLEKASLGDLGGAKLLQTPAPRPASVSPVRVAPPPATTLPAVPQPRPVPPAK